MNLHQTSKGKKMKKLHATLICIASYCLGSTSVLAHGAHGAETSFFHLFSEPQHATGLVATMSLLAVVVALRNRRQTVEIKK